MCKGIGENLKWICNQEKYTKYSILYTKSVTEELWKVNRCIVLSAEIEQKD